MATQKKGIHEKNEMPPPQMQPPMDTPRSKAGQVPDVPQSVEEEMKQLFKSFLEAVLGASVGLFSMFLLPIVLVWRLGNTGWYLADAFIDEMLEQI